MAEHNNNNDCWIIIHNKIYDITPFIYEHPGGGDVLLAKAVCILLL